MLFVYLAMSEVFVNVKYPSSHFLSWESTRARWWMVSRFPRGI